MGRFNSRSSMLNQTENLLKLIERQAATIERLEVQLADCCISAGMLDLDVQRLNQELVHQAAETFSAERTNRELRERIATLERVPSMATSVSWSRVRDYSEEA